MRRQIIDYFGTRPSEGHAPHIPRGFSHPQGDKLSTTTVLDGGKLPISQEDFLVHEATNHRLLQYSTFGGTCSPHPKRIISSMRRQIIDYYSTQSSDGTSSLFPKRNFFIHETTNYSTTSVLDLRRDMLPISQEDFLVHEATNY